ncbi:hypothetical protein BMETH_112_2 [methanotrophic bacterial endosymbiont of Bathymodiolus sp.]|nr:hypothetical protein BMETH_112_2 [methanotrophic bacterial endosymbiont of Bathymodiolus sp.]
MSTTVPTSIAPVRISVCFTLSSNKSAKLSLIVFRPRLVCTIQVSISVVKKIAVCHHTASKCIT